MTLTAQEIFDNIMKGNRIEYPLGTTNSNDYQINFDQFNKLMAHLAVIKSRSKKLYQDLQLNFDNVLIKTEVYVNAENFASFIIFIVKGEPLRKTFECNILK